MRTQDSIQKIRDAVLAGVDKGEPVWRLNEKRLNEKLTQYRKGGLPASSFSDGRGSAETPLPGRDRTDTQIDGARDTYRDLLTAAALALEKARRIEMYWCNPYDGDPAETSKVELAGKPCSNVWCDHVCSGKKDDKLRNGRCPSCAQYFRRTGRERDPRLTAANALKTGRIEVAPAAR